MEQLTVKTLKTLLDNYPDDAIIYLGDDEELNGIHGAYFCQNEDADMIKQMSYGGYNKGGILIS